MVVEYWYVVVQVLGMIGFVMNRGKQDESTQLDELWSAFRRASFVLDWTRIMAHALFINQLDELYLTSPQSNDTQTPAPETEMTATDLTDTDLVPLVRR
jgi:hypothetical protein